MAGVPNQRPADRSPRCRSAPIPSTCFPLSDGSSRRRDREAAPARRLRPDCVPSLGPGEEQRKVDEGARRQPGGIGTIRTGVDGPAEEERRDGIANPDPPNRSGVHVMKIGGRGGDQLHLGKGLLPRFPQRTIPNRLAGLLPPPTPPTRHAVPFSVSGTPSAFKVRSKRRPFARITPAQKGWFRVREAMSISVSSTGIFS